MDEDVLAAVHGNKAKALLGVIPFDLTLHFLGRPCGTLKGARRAAATTTAESRRPARRLGGAGVNIGDLSDLRPLCALPDSYRQRGARFERAVPSPLNHADVQECFAGSVGQFDKSEPLLTVEPFHLGLPLRPARHWPGLPRRTVKGTRRGAAI